MKKDWNWIRVGAVVCAAVLLLLLAWQAAPLCVL